MLSEGAGREILTRLRRGCRGAGAEQIAAERRELPRSLQAPLPSDDLLLAFAANVLRGGGEVQSLSSRSEAVSAIGEFIGRRHGQRRLVAGHDPRLAALPWRDGGLLPRFGAVEAGDAVAVSYACAGIAETGSVVLPLDRNNPALNNLLPADHLVLVDARDVVRRLEEGLAMAGLADGETRPRGVVLVSGPSSTADIALQMVRGAHGPTCWQVLLLAPNVDGAELRRRAGELAAVSPAPGS